MGAYYQAVCTGTNEAISPSITEDFYKLMEHSWIGNEFLNLVLHNIHKGSWKNQPVVWSCDYDDDSLWNVSKNISFSEDVIHASKWKGYEDCIILNNSKKEFIDLVEYKQKFFYRGHGTVHPFSLLTSQATHSMGGGDYHADSADRGRWSGDKFVVTFNKHKIPSDYKNISDVFFSENPDEIEIRNNAFIEKCGNSKGPDLFSNKPISLLKLVKGASKKNLKNSYLLVIRGNLHSRKKMARLRREMQIRAMIIVIIILKMILPFSPSLILMLISLKNSSLRTLLRL